MSARELTQASLDRIEATEPLNHWTLVDAEGALAAADAIGSGDERPFAGVPLALKDLFLPVKGMRLTQGSDITPDFVPDYDSAAGAPLPRGRASCSWAAPSRRSSGSCP